MLPCKPDKGARTVPMAGREVSLQVIGCDTGGATFAVMFADLGDPGARRRGVGQWKEASLLNMQREPLTRSPVQAGRSAGVAAVAAGRGQWSARRRQQVRKPGCVLRPWRHVFQAVIYSRPAQARGGRAVLLGAQVPMSLLSRRTAVAVFLAFAFAYFFSALLRAITATLSSTLTQEFALNAQRAGLAGGRLFPRLRGNPASLGNLAGSPWTQEGDPRLSGYRRGRLRGVLAGHQFLRPARGPRALRCGGWRLPDGAAHGFRRWLDPTAQLRANSWMLMTGSFGMVASTLPVQLADARDGLAPAVLGPCRRDRRLHGRDRLEGAALGRRRGRARQAAAAAIAKSGPIRTSAG